METRGQLGARTRTVAALITTGLATMFTASVEAAGSLDSRTIPHPEWTQISGQIEQTSAMGAKNDGDSLQAIVRLSEGGRISVDFGAPTTGSFQPKRDDFIHVRGQAVEREGQVTILAHEVYADGKVFSIHRNDTAAQDTAQSLSADSAESVPLSRAAPIPSR